MITGGGGGDEEELQGAGRCLGSGECLHIAD